MLSDWLDEKIGKAGKCFKIKILHNIYIGPVLETKTCRVSLHKYSILLWLLDLSHNVVKLLLILLLLYL